MKKNLTAIVGALLALALIASACGGDDGNASSADQAVIDAVARQLNEGDDAPEGVDVDCMAAAMVTGMGGAEAMETNFGLTAESIDAGNDAVDVELSKDQAISLASSAMDCGLGDSILTEMTGDGLPEEDARCLLDALDQDLIRDMMATEFMNEADAAAVSAEAEDDLFGALFGAIADCDIDPTSLG